MSFQLNKFYKCKNGKVAEIVQIGQRDKLFYTGARTMEFRPVKYFFAKIDDKRVYFDEEGKATSFLDTPYDGLDIVNKEPLEVEVII